MKECGIAKENISAYVDGELWGIELERFEKHISSCDECCLLVDETREIAALCRDIPQMELPPGYRESLHGKLATESAGLSGGRKRNLSGERKRSLSGERGRSLFGRLPVKVLSTLAAGLLLVVILQFTVGNLFFVKNNDTSRINMNLNRSISAPGKNSANTPKSPETAKRGEESVASSAGTSEKEAKTAQSPAPNDAKEDDISATGGGPHNTVPTAPGNTIPKSAEAVGNSAGNAADQPLVMMTKQMQDTPDKGAANTNGSEGNKQKIVPARTTADEASTDRAGDERNNPVFTNIIPVNIQVSGNSDTINGKISECADKLGAVTISSLEGEYDTVNSSFANNMAVYADASAAPSTPSVSSGNAASAESDSSAAPTAPAAPISPAAGGNTNNTANGNRNGQAIFVLDYKVRNSNLAQFINYLGLALTTAKIQQGVPVRINLSDSLMQMNTQLTGVNSKINGLKGQDGGTNNDELMQLMGTRDALQTDITNIRNDRDFTFVRIILEIRR